MKNKEITQWFIAGALVLVFLFILIYQLQQIRERTPRANFDLETPVLVVPGLPDALPLFDQLEAEARQLMFKRDPFVRAPLPEPPKEPVLMGIAWEDDNPTVIIDNMILKKGEILNGKTVVDIFPDSVILNDGVRDTRLFLDGAKP